MVYHNAIAMGPDKFEKRFGNDIITFEEYKKHAYDSLPKDIVQILNMPDKAFNSESTKSSWSDLVWNCLFGLSQKVEPIKKIGDTHVLLYVHESYTTNQLSELFKQCFPNNPNGYAYINPDILNQYGDEPIGESGWILMTKDVLPGSRGKSPKEKQGLIEDLAKRSNLPYEQPKLVRAIAAVIAEYVRTDGQVYLFPAEPFTYTRVEEKINGWTYPCTVGIFGPSGLFVSVDYYDDGLAALLRCRPSEVS